MQFILNFLEEKTQYVFPLKECKDFIFLWPFLTLSPLSNRRSKMSEAVSHCVLNLRCPDDRDRAYLCACLMVMCLLCRVSVCLNPFSTFERFYVIFNYVSGCVWVWARAHVGAGTRGGQKMSLDPLKLELQAVGSCLKWALETELRSSALNH